MIKIFTLLLAASAPAFAAELPQAWTPKVEFSLEDANFKETMHWVSGWSYALTELGKASAKSGQTGLICLPKNGYVESRVLLDILNKKYKGKRVTSEQAAATLWSGATTYYRCRKLV